uniref:Uncharacterized protein n=1 Tax=Polysiphonia sp. TaxID=1967842 RepID=A0A1Z1M3P5_9FLOR|nr:hypothetical protein [Polysiphonia sp.]
MNDSILFFRFYVFIFIFFLLLFSFFLSKQIVSILINHFKLIYLLHNFKTKLSFTENDFTYLFDIYLFRKNLFLAIALCEFALQIDYIFFTKDCIHAFLAYCYYRSSFYGVAEYYYFKIISFSPDNLEALVNLGKMYYDLGYKAKAKLIFNRVYTLRPGFTLPSRYSI